MFAEFVHYYPGYTVESALREYAVTFYALLGAMYRIKAMDRIDDTYGRIASRAGGAGLDDYLKEQRRQAGGGHAILEEVLTIKQALKNVN